jgi:hypothetical protein
VLWFAGCETETENKKDENQNSPGSGEGSGFNHDFDDGYTFEPSILSVYVSGNGNDATLDGTVEGTPYKTLAKAYEAALANADHKRIVVLTDLSETGPVMLNPTGKPKKGDDPILIEGKTAKLKIERSEGINDSVLVIAKGAKIIFKNIMIDGNKNETVYHRAITVEGTTNNVTEVTLGEKTVITGKVVNVRGGGIELLSYAKLTMNAGAVITNSFARDGGGVQLHGGTFIMKGGEIRGNSSMADGGGVYMTGDSNMTPGGGKEGEKNTFEMTGGMISDNTSGINGGGVAFMRGRFTITDGAIGGNKAGSKGGGVYMTRMDGNDATSTFAMNGGVIHGKTEAVEALRNTATKTGSAAFYYGDNGVAHVPADLAPTDKNIDKRPKTP